MNDPKALPRDWPPVLDRQLSEDHANTGIERIPALDRDSNKTFRPGTAEHLQNILDISGVPLLVVDGNLKLLSFTSAVIALFDVAATDLGRPLAEITRRFADEDFLLDAQTAIAIRMPICRDIKTDNGGHYKLSLLPYCVEDNDVRGLAISFSDISDTEAAKRAFDRAEAFSNSIIDVLHESLVMLDEELRVISATPRFYHNFVVRPEDAVGELLWNLCERCLDVPAFRIFLVLISAGEDVAEDYEIEIELSPYGRRILILNAQNIPAEPPEKKKILLAIDDIADRKQAGHGHAGAIIA